MTTLLQHPRPGDVVRGKRFKFQVLERLKAGGQNNALFKVCKFGALSSSVLLAKFFRGNTVCLAADGLGDPDQRLFKRFKKEVEFLRIFSNRPNIVNLIDQSENFESEQCADKAFFVMEFLDGAPLEQRVGHPSMSPWRVLYTAGEIARGLAEIHSKNVVHRDLHPGNVFVNLLMVKIIDFGSAVGGDVTRPYAYEPHYSPIGGEFHRAPEVSNPQDAISASDVFSVGVTLVELASGCLIRNDCGHVNQRGLWLERRIESLRTKYPAAFLNLLRDMVNCSAKERPTAACVMATLKRIKIPIALTDTLEIGWEVAKLAGTVVAGGVFAAVVIAAIRDTSSTQDK